MERAALVYRYRSVIDHGVPHVSINGAANLVHRRLVSPPPPSPPSDASCLLLHPPPPLASTRSDAK